ncbi:hypothetical protein ACFQ71_03105 [Streptomyces sp. NPDC056534]|uniref:hypothetical protein n=1 Tax=Streptomyces sp. NPDC056534 TaxID=3345857 RepID=UPI00367D3622
MQETRTWLSGIPIGGIGGARRESTWEAETVEVRVDYGTLGVLILYTRGKLADWVDVIISDLALESLTTERIYRLQGELGARAASLEIARTSYDRGHAEIPGSSAFTIIRLSSVGVRIERGTSAAVGFADGAVP